MKARYPAVLRRYTGKRSDGYGAGDHTWEPQGERVKYFGLNRPTSDEPNAETNRLEVELVMLAPLQLVNKVSERDILEVNGEVFYVDGIPGSTEYTPFRYRPGGRINLRRTVG